MATYLLVAGAWLGGWAWDGVAPSLRDRGRDVHPLTLSGSARSWEAARDSSTSNARSPTSCRVLNHTTLRVRESSTRRTQQRSRPR
jgi:hypothetical protein